MGSGLCVGYLLLFAWHRHVDESLFGYWAPGVPEMVGMNGQVLLRGSELGRL